MQERVFMGIGNKPFMDILPSDAAIHNRAINYVLMGRGETLLLFTHSATSDMSLKDITGPGDQTIVAVSPKTSDLQYNLAKSLVVVPFLPCLSLRA